MTPEILQNGLGLKLSQEQDAYLQRKYDFPLTYRRDEAGQVCGLNLRGAKLSAQQVEFVQNIEGLNVLNLSETGIVFFQIKDCLKKLQFLNLSDNESLKELDFQTTLSFLEHLDLNNCRLEEVVFLDGFSCLKKLILTKNYLKTIQFNGACPALEYLELYGNSLNSFHLPAGFGRLAYLFLNDNYIEDWSIAGELPELLFLDLSYNELKTFDLSLLHRAPALKALFLRHNDGFPKDLLYAADYHKNALHKMLEFEKKGNCS